MSLRLAACMVAIAIVAVFLILSISPPQADPQLNAPPLPEQAPGAQPRLVVTTLLNRIYKKYKSHAAGPCYTLSTAAAAGLEMDIHGWALPGYNVTKERIVLISRYLRRYRDTDVVMFVDAGDSLFYGGRDLILSAFRKMQERHPGKAIFSAERFCPPEYAINWPTATLGPYHCLNTGGWIGYARDLRKVFDLFLTLFHESKGLAVWLEDQNFISFKWKSAKLDELIALDNDTSIWLPMFQDRGMGWKARGDRWKYCVWDLFPNLRPGGRLTPPFTNHATNSTPPVIHFNGPAKACWMNFMGATPKPLYATRADTVNLIGEDGVAKPTPVASLCDHSYLREQ